MARRAVQTLVQELVAAGGEYRLAAVRPPGDGRRPRARWTPRRARCGRAATSSLAGRGCRRCSPALLGARIFPTRQEVFFFAPESGDDRFSPARLPGWADFNDGDIYYGFPDLESRGFKIAHDKHGPAFDPDTGDRQPSADAIRGCARVSRPAVPRPRRAALVESRVCQYENSSNGDLLIDRHPRWANALLLGAGSGHGFKHGPAVGRYAADLVPGRWKSRRRGSAFPPRAKRSSARCTDRSVPHRPADLDNTRRDPAKSRSRRFVSTALNEEAPCSPCGARGS